MPPGANFPEALKDGLVARGAGSAPEAIARVRVFVNTRRMQRTVRSAFADGTASLLPRLELISDLGAAAVLPGVPPSVPPLRRKLELTQLVSALLAKEPDLAPASAMFQLADSLSALLDEMQGEAVSFEAVRKLDVSGHSAYWERSLRFLSIVEHYLDATGPTAPDPEARQRLAVLHLASKWHDAPPQTPVIVAGSTGSRRTTMALMEAVARLPRGAIILPGFDFEMPDAAWADLIGSDIPEDHPQSRFAILLKRLGIARPDVAPWGAEAPAPDRNHVVSLSLRPAPVTSQWMSEGQDLPDLRDAMASVTLLEAPSPQSEAMAIAVRLREEAETGRTAALISPDRMLTRRVAAALDRWGITPDDSAGRPLALSAPGRFLRHVGALFSQKLTAEALLVLLKHPLTNTGADDRGLHLLWTRELELWFRGQGPPFPEATDLARWAHGHGEVDRTHWADWIGLALCGKDDPAELDLPSHIDRHVKLAETIATGPRGHQAGQLWEQAAGRKAIELVTDLRREAPVAGRMSQGDYDALFQSVLNRADVRVPDGPFPNIMIWGTREARVQGAGLVILGGLNEGVWPEAPSPDPWLNRAMRRDAGLLMPDRRIGLSAHDYQQAVGAREVVLSRAIRDADAETIPSRWVNRLTNLLAGLRGRGGEAALAEMRKKGRRLLHNATALDTRSEPIPAEKRPAPCPPVALRPRTLSVTSIERLIRDPYAIYARYILRLKKVDPLRMAPDAPLRGEVIHRIFEAFSRRGIDAASPQAKADLLDVTRCILDQHAPWPAARKMWFARIERVADWFLQGEAVRQATGEMIAVETKGAYRFADVDFSLTATADRIDRIETGGLAIYDYKTGHVPTAKEVRHFAKQLLLEAIVAEHGGFEGVGPETTTALTYIGLGAQPKTETIAPQDDPDAGFSIQATTDEFKKLIAAYDAPGRGYPSRRSVFNLAFDGDYDHLARHGEWDESAVPRLIRLA
ncbi:MAG: PD-(D/E)XK nuclease family protein [Alphaproteobacteria bacterium]|nr:PD-(D/E)XK nuclease family protein [Alphaproteobacteria bacterium]